MATIDTTTIVSVEEIKVPPAVVEIGEWTERTREELRRKIKKNNKKGEKLRSKWDSMPKKLKLTPFIVVDQQTTVVAAQPASS